MNFYNNFDGGCETTSCRCARLLLEPGQLVRVEQARR